jgi:hypothetical protein
MENIKSLKITTAFYLGFAREGVKRRFPVTYVSADNVTPCHGEHVARELQVG